MVRRRDMVMDVAGMSVGFSFYMPTKLAQDEQKVFVVLHGSFTTRAYMEPVAADISARFPNDFVVNIDLPGRGESSCKPLKHAHAITEVVRKLIEELRLKDWIPPRTVLIGHDFGGSIAMMLALQGLTNIQTIYGIHTAPAWTGLEYLTEIPADELVAIYTEKMVADFGVGLPENKQVELIERVPQFVADVEACAADAAALTTFSIVDELYLVDVPVVVIAGKQDDIVPETSQHLMRDMLPFVNYYELPKATHNFPLKNPGSVGEVLHSFLE